MGKRKRRNGTAVPAAAPARISNGPLLLGILAFALAVRIAYLALSRQSPFFEPLLLDPAYYHQWASRIAVGDLGNEPFHGLPLYPFFLALVYKLTAGSVDAVKFVQAALGLVTVFFVWKTAEKIASRRAAFLASLLAACYGPLFFHEGIFIPEAVAVPLYAAAFYCACVFFEAPTARRGALTGVLFGLAALAKAGIIPFVLVFAAVSAAAARKAGKGVVPVAALALAFLATLAPVTLHNVVRGKDFVPLTSHAGLNFYIGNNPDAEGVFRAPRGMGSNVDAQIRDSKAMAEAEEGRPLKPSEVSRHWSRRAWRWIASDPAGFAALSFRKLLLFFDGREISDVDDYWFARKFNPMLRFPWPDFAWLGPLALLGFVLAMSGAARHRGLVAAWLGGYLAGLVFFFINGRYRLPLLGVLLPLAGIAIERILWALRERKWARLAAFGAVIAAGAGLAGLRLVGTDWARDYVNAGDVYVMKGDYARAIEWYERAIEANPASPKAHLGMGLALTRSGRGMEAKRFYEKTIELDPNYSLAYNNLGLVYDKEGDLEKAERCFLKAIELKPNSDQAMNNLGMVYGKRGENEKALELFERSLALTPRDAVTLTNRGLILYRLGRKREAARDWAEAVKIDPSYREAQKALYIARSEGY